MTDRVRIWTVRTDAEPQLFEHCAAVLDPNERLRAADYLRERDRLHFTIAHGAQRLILARELGVPPESLTFTIGEHGKPILDAAHHTSLSHSGGLCLVAVTEARPVGVDVQHLAEGLDPVGMSTRYFLPFEARYVAAGHDPLEQTDRFARLWTRKEAAVKAVGGRLWANLRAAVLQRDLVSLVDPAGPQRYRVAPVEVPGGYRAAVALAGEAPFGVEVVEFVV